MIVDNIDLEPYEWNDEFVRWTVLDLLKVMNQSTLANLCPLPQSMISNIVNSKYPSSLSSEKLRAFGTWYKDYKASQQHYRHQKQGESQDSIRVTFHPNIEVPRLKAWYQEHPLPSEKLLSMYASDLNNSLVRWERPKIQVKHLKQWWVNQKQKLKREEKEKSLERIEEGNVTQSKKCKVASQSSKSAEKLQKNQKVENEVRKVERQGVVCEINILQTLPSENTENVKSKVRKTEPENFNINASRNSISNTYVPVTEHRVDHQGFIISHSTPLSASNNTDQSDHFQYSHRSLDLSRHLEKGPGYQYHGVSVVREVTSEEDSHYQPL